MQLRTVVLGSGYHIASISVGCSRLFLSLHNWSYEQKHPSMIANPEAEPNSGSSTQSRKSTTVLLRDAPQAGGEYELDVRKVSDLESARAKPKGPESDIAATEPGASAHSMLPSIERPSLPESMWSTLPGPHARQQQQQRQAPPRPLRSSSLYLDGNVPNTRQHSRLSGRVGRVEEIDESESGLDERAGTNRKYNVV